MRRDDTSLPRLAASPTLYDFSYFEMDAGIFGLCSFAVALFYTDGIVWVQMVGLPGFCINQRRKDNIMLTFGIVTIVAAVIAEALIVSKKINLD